MGIIDISICLYQNANRFHLVLGVLAFIMLSKFLQLIVLTLFFCIGQARADAMTAVDPSQRLLQMLDYVGVDYPPTVSEGAVVDAIEYAEMQEFSGEITHLLAAMPEAANKAELVQRAEAIRDAVQARAQGSQISVLTAQLKQALISTYQITVAPKHVPRMDTVLANFEANCASCHGSLGYGDGPLAAQMDPAPSNFHAADRQHTRSVYDLYNTITLGVMGTPMPAFAQLTDDERWALALMVSRFSGTPVQRQSGEQLWQQGQLQAQFRALADLTSTSYAKAGELALDAGLSASDGEAILTYLRNTPEIFQVSDNLALDTSIAKLAQSVELARDGEAKAAHEMAVSAYLDGFELAEASVVVLNKTLKLKIEKAMIEFRELAKQGDGAALETKRVEVVYLLEDAKRLLSESVLSGEAAFTGAFIILLREGVEAILVLAAIMTALIKTGRRDAMKYIHAGWIGAVVLGVVTWWVADNLISISGASRELTEGVAALLAAIILVYVGFWLHNASHSKRWQQFVQHKVENAMEGSTLWMLALVSFLAVYREMFETVLFYQAMWVQIDDGAERAFVFGIVVALALLVVISLLIYRMGVKLPIRQFFQVNAVLLFLMAVIFAGQGVARLQEVGMVNTSMLDFPRIEILGVYPTMQSLSLQLLVLILGAGLMLYQRRED